MHVTVGTFIEFTKTSYDSRAMKVPSHASAVITLTLVLLLLAQAAAQALSDKSWQEYKYPENGFAITLPGDPHPHKSTQMPHGTAYTVTFSGGSGLSIHTMPAAGTCTQLLDSQAANAKRSMRSGSQVKGFKLTWFNDVEGSGYKGFELVQQVPNGQMDYERWVCGAHRLFVFGSQWKPGEKQPEEISRIVNSFHLLSADSQ